MPRMKAVEEEELVGIGVGGWKKGASNMIVNDKLVPIDDVDVNTFLGAIAACTAKKVSLLLPALKSIIVIVKAYGDSDTEEISYLALEVSYEGENDLEPNVVEKAMEFCPILKFLGDKIRRVSISPGI